MAAPGTPKASRTPSLSSTRTAACIAVIFAIAASSRRGRNHDETRPPPRATSEPFPRCGKPGAFSFARRGLAVSTEGAGDRRRRAAHQRGEAGDALVGQAHGGGGERDGAHRLAMLVEHRGGDAAQPDRMLLVVEC